LTDSGPDDFRNAPLAVQLVGMKQEDGSLMSVAKAVDDALRACTSDQVPAGS